MRYNPDTGKKESKGKPREYENKRKEKREEL